MAKYIVKTSDLTGGITDFPRIIVQRMMDRARIQAAFPSINAFQRNASASSLVGGFDWSRSLERGDFWCDVIMNRRFNKFFSRYPIRRPKYIFATGNGNLGAEDLAIHYGASIKLALRATEGIYFIQGKYPFLLEYRHPSAPDYNDIIARGTRYRPVKE